MAHRSTLPFLNPKPVSNDPPSLSFNTRPALNSRHKENQTPLSILTAKARNIITKSKTFGSSDLTFCSPDLTFALTDAIRREATQYGDAKWETEKSPCISKTFHHSNQGSPEVKRGCKLIEVSRHKNTFYAVNKERQKAIDLAEWVQSKMLALNTQGATLQDILDYKQTVVNYGLGEIIDSVSRRCKEEGQTLRYIWDTTFNLFENLLNVVTEEIRKKDEEMFQSEEQMNAVYLTNIKSLKAKNAEQEEHMEMLYDKMCKVIKWNRKLKKERQRHKLEQKIAQYRLDGYVVALEEATSMLLTESKEPNCLHLAKRILKKLHLKKYLKKPKPLKKEVSDSIYASSRDYVLEWLRKYSFEDEQKLMEAVCLSENEAGELDAAEMNVYDYFQTYERGVQVQSSAADYQTQYQYQEEKTKCINIGIGTKRVFLTSTPSQTAAVTISQSDQPKKSPDNKSKAMRDTIVMKENKLNKSKRASASGPPPNINVQNKRRSSLRPSILQPVNKTSSKSGFKGDDSVNTPIIEEQFGPENNDKFSNNSISVDKETQKLLNVEGGPSNNHMRGLSQNSFKSQMEWEMSDEKGLMRKIPKRESFEGKPQRSRTPRYTGSYRNIESDGREKRENSIQPLQRSKFDEVYSSKMKGEMNLRKQEFVGNIMRRRSFYRPNAAKTDEKDLGYLLRPGKYFAAALNESLNKCDEYLQSHLRLLMKKSNASISLSKARNQQYASNLIHSIGNSLRASPDRSIPRNKQFVTLSVSTIVRLVSKMLIDYLRKIKADREKIFFDMDRSCYPLSAIIIDQMTNKHGLREIAQKKLKDLLQKMNLFVLASEKLKMFFRLLGLDREDSMIGAEELIIYMKCLVYFDTSRSISLFNTGKEKDFSIERITTDKETVLEEIDDLVKQFFPVEERQAVKDCVTNELKACQMNVEIEVIASILIDKFLNIKENRFAEYSRIWRNCQGNFFSNLYKMLMAGEVSPADRTRIMGEMFKNIDSVDDFSCKSMSEIKFVGVCIKVNVPMHSTLMENMIKYSESLTKAAKLSEPNRQERMKKIMKQNRIRVEIGKEAPDFKLVQTAIMGMEMASIHSEGVLGHLGDLSRANSQLEWKLL